MASMAVSTFIVTCAPSCCSLRELLLAMSRCEVLGRDSPGRVGWISLAVVALWGRGGKGAVELQLYENVLLIFPRLLWC